LKIDFGFVLLRDRGGFVRLATAPSAGRLPGHELQPRTMQEAVAEQATVPGL